jgi:ketosteroid isomerase-like protein
MRKYFSLWLFVLSVSAFAQKKNIQPSAMPNGALDFIEANFKSVALHHCFKFTEGDLTRFKAVMADDTEIEFAEDGKWTEVDGSGHAVLSAFLGPAIIELIKKAHPGQRVLKAQKHGNKIEVTLTDGKKMEF